MWGCIDPKPGSAGGESGIRPCYLEKEKVMQDNDLLDYIEKLVDKAENYMALSEVPLSPPLQIIGLKQGIVELRDCLRTLYEDQGGSCNVTWPLGPYGEHD